MKLKRITTDLNKLIKEREDLTKKYDGELPGYLVDYFDRLEEQLEKGEAYKEVSRKEKIEKDKKEFWENNELKVVSLSRARPDSAEKIGLDLYEEEKLKNIDTKHIVAACSTRLDAFAKFYFPHFLRKPNSKLHKFLYRIAATEINKKSGRGCRWAVAAPRGSAKSSLISCILPIWCTVYNKKSFILILSDTLGQASDFLADIRRELESNVRLQRDFPHACGKGSTWRVDEIVTRNDVKILALGSGSKIRGRRFGTKRPDLILLDDIENLEMVKSDTQRTDLKKWFDDDVMFVGGESGTKLDIFAVGTILGKEALLTSLVDPTKYPNFQSKVFSAVEKFSSSDLWAEWESLFTDPLDKDREVTARNFFEEHKEQMLRGTKVLWPEGDPYYDLMVNKLVNPSGFLAEKMNSPIDYTKVKVRREELHFKDFRDPYMQNLLSECPTFGAIDPSLGKNVKSGDFSAIVTMKRDKNTGLIYVPDIIMKRLDPDRQIDIILDLHEKRFFKLFGVETNAFQIILANLLRAKSRKRGSYLPIKEIQNYSDKVMRLEGIFPFIKDGTIIFDEYKYKHNRVYRNAIEQLLAYTGGKNERDDFIDALQMCFSIIRGTTFKMLTKQTGYRRRYAH